MTKIDDTIKTVVERTNLQRQIKPEDVIEILKIMKDRGEELNKIAKQAAEIINDSASDNVIIMNLSIFLSCLLENCNVTPISIVGVLEAEKFKTQINVFNVKY